MATPFSAEDGLHISFSQYLLNKPDFTGVWSSTVPDCAGLGLDPSHCEINFAGVPSVEVRPAISTDPNPNPNRISNCKLSLLEMVKNNITR